jgi:dCMP deaminase
MLINCRIRAIYFSRGYPDDLSRSFLDDAGIDYERLACATGSREEP